MNSDQITLEKFDRGGAFVLVEGADADWVIDNKLIDVRTTKKLGLEVNHWRQLVGHAVLADIANENDLWI